MLGEGGLSFEIGFRNIGGGIGQEPEQLRSENTPQREEVQPEIPTQPEISPPQNLPPDYQEPDEQREDEQRETEKSLTELANEVISQLKEALPAAEIKPLPPAAIFLADAFLKLFKRSSESEAPNTPVRDSKAKSKKEKPEREEGVYLPTNLRRKSIWGAYAWLNLGPEARKREELKRATRFVHLLPIEANLGFSQITEETIKEELFKLFKEENAFPWRMPNGMIVGDYGILVTTKDEIVCIKPEDLSPSEQSSNFPKGKVLVLFNESNLSYRQLPKFHQLLDHYPIIIVITPPSQEGNFGTITIGANHEYIDGVPAADLICRLGERLGFVINPNNLNVERLEALMTDLDQWENSGSDAYLIKTLFLDPELTKKILDLFEKIKAKLPGEDISNNTLFQILLLSLYLKPHQIRGGVLRFRKEVERQLEHYRIPDYEGENLFMLLTEALEQGQIDEVKKIMDIYNKRYANIVGIIGEIKSRVPESLWPFLNHLSKILGISRAITGQVMVSYIPQGFDVNRKFNEGFGAILERETYGFGGPAMTEFQDVAFTVTLIKKNKDIIIVIIRVKARRFS